MRSFKGLLTLLFIVLLSVKGLMAEEAAAAVSKEDLNAITANLNIVWTLVAAILVFWMQAGFAMVETGFTRSKNSVNILMKNLMDFCIGSIAFYTIGFGLMFGAAKAGIIGTDLFFMKGIVGAEGGSEWGWTFMIFQTVFAATAATIVSGAMLKERSLRLILLIVL
jgi:Amt family ammonium transporter